MMPAVPSKRIWLSPLGQTVYENLNPYWFYCDHSGVMPERIVLLHATEMEERKSLTVRAFSLVSAQYKEDAGIDISGIAFDDEDVDGFQAKVAALFEQAGEENSRVIVDVSPTTWSFVPIHLMAMAKTFRNLVEHVIYLQYVEHRLRLRPYPLIQRMGLRFHDLATEISGKRGKR